jgi:hypothetical protein
MVGPTVELTEIKVWYRATCFDGKVARSNHVRLNRREKEATMSVLTVLIVVALFATVAALTSGIVSMAHGGEYDVRHSTKMMLARVGLQGLTFVLLIVALLATLR